MNIAATTNNIVFVQLNKVSTIIINMMLSQNQESEQKKDGDKNTNRISDNELSNQDNNNVVMKEINKNNNKINNDNADYQQLQLLVIKKHQIN